MFSRLRIIKHCSRSLSLSLVMNKNITFECYTALGGVNIKALLDDASYEVGGKLLLDFNDSRGDRIQVFLE